MFESDPTSVDAIVRVIQSSLTPIFLLTAIASLLGVFNTRLSRISDQVKTLSEMSDAPVAKGESARTGAGQATDNRARIHRLDHLRKRSRMLDVAVISAAFGGACTCGTVLALFLGLLRSRATVSLLFFLFGLAILCTITALAAFLIEVLWASRGVRADVEWHIQNQTSSYGDQ